MMGERASWLGSTFRLAPTCRKLLRVAVSRRETKTCHFPFGPISGQAIQGTVLSPAIRLPAAMEASLASFNGLMFKAQVVSSPGWQAGTLIHLKPPGALASATPRAVKMRLARSPPVSCQVTQGTELAVSAKTPVGWKELRNGSTFRVGSLALSTPTASQRNPPSTVESPLSSFTPLLTKICVAFELMEGSSHATHGTGGLVGSPEPE